MISKKWDRRRIKKTLKRIRPDIFLKVKNSPLRFKVWYFYRKIVLERLQNIILRYGITKVQYDPWNTHDIVKTTMGIMATRVCKDVGCSGMNPDLCESHPEDCEIVKKIMITSE